MPDYAAYLHHRSACVELEQRIAQYLRVDADAPIMRELRETVDRECRGEQADCAQSGGALNGGALDTSLPDVVRIPSKAPNEGWSSQATRRDDGWSRGLLSRLLAAGGLASAGNAALRRTQGYLAPERATVVHMVRAPAEYVDSRGKAGHASDWVVVLSTHPDRYRCYPVAADRVRALVADLIPAQGRDQDVLARFLERAVAEPSPSAEELQRVTRQRIELRRSSLSGAGAGVRAGLRASAELLRYAGSPSESPFCALLSGGGGRWDCLSLHAGSDQEPEAFGDWAQLAALLGRLQRTDPPPAPGIFRSAQPVHGQQRTMARLAHVFVLEGLLREGRSLGQAGLLERATARSSSLFGGDGLYYPEPDPDTLLAGAVDLASWVALRKEALFAAAARAQSGEADPEAALRSVNELRQLWFHAEGTERPPAVLRATPLPLRFDSAVLASPDLHCGARLFRGTHVGESVDLVRKGSSEVHFSLGGRSTYRIADNPEVSRLLSQARVVAAQVTRVEEDRVTLRVRPAGMVLEAGEGTTVVLPNPLDNDLSPFSATQRGGQAGGGAGLVAGLLAELYG